MNAGGWLGRDGWRTWGWPLLGIAASSLLLGLYARGGWAWPLGFIALVPWLITLNRARATRHALLSGWLMTMAFVLVVFGWFATAVSSFTGVHPILALLLMTVAAPLLQPQWLAFVLGRSSLSASGAWWLRAMVGAAAWVACEWLFPKLLGDSLGHGIYPSEPLRQWAELGGVAGISFMLIISNELIAHALLQGRKGLRAALAPLACTLLLFALMMAHGYWTLGLLRVELTKPAPSMRLGLVQTAIVDYEKRRREVGAYAVVREVLDTHFALSQAAIEQHGVDALLWSETVYPTTFGHPRSEDGAALDQEIIGFVAAMQRPLAFGTYDLDEAGEYNAAAFVDPAEGLLGFYRKTHPFPLTETVPDWLDGPGFRRWFPWTGGWRPGNGARVFPLKTLDGRELNVMPLICLDGVRPQLAIDGTRLGAQAIVSLSNDSWFSADPQGARLHLIVAAFRSVETRLPQVRATANGLSAIIDPLGEVIASTSMGDRAVLAGDLPLRSPPSTLMVRWGNWVGPAALAWLALLVLLRILAWWSGERTRHGAPAASPDDAKASLENMPATLWSPIARMIAAGLHLAAAAGLIGIALRMALRDGMQVNSLGQIQIYLWTVLLPLVAGWIVRKCCAARLRIEGDDLILEQARQRIEIPIRNIAALEVWRIPVSGIGLNLHLASGRRWDPAIGVADPEAFLQALIATGSTVQWRDSSSRRRSAFAAVRAAGKRVWLDHGVVRYLLFPLIPALIAFRLHQQIAFGGTFGEYYTFGLGAWLLGLLLWWASWSLGLMLFAALLRVIIEVVSWLIFRLQPRSAGSIRTALEIAGRALFYIGIPVWLVLRIVAA